MFSGSTFESKDELALRSRAKALKHWASRGDHQKAQDMRKTLMRTINGIKRKGREIFVTSGGNPAIRNRQL